MTATRLTIRSRERRQASLREGLRQAWTEWQVVDGRRVVSRHDFEHQAIAWRERNAERFPEQ